MRNLFLFFTELFILFLLSRSVTKNLSSFIYNQTRSKRITITVMAVLFFPGTIIHELSHYLTAKFLFVRTYGINLFPKLDGENLKLGSVSIEKTDFFRHLLIGMAPFFTGTSILVGTLYVGTQHHLLSQPIPLAIICYILFEIGNTMFSSKRDMEGAIELLLAIIFLFAITWLAGIQIPSLNPTSIISTDVVQQTFEKGSFFLLAPLSINLLLVLFLKLLHQHN